MIRLLMRTFTSVSCAIVVGLLILIPLSLGIYSALHDLLAGKDVEHIVEHLEGLAIILIGWGVALEERESLRRMAGLIGKDGDDERQTALDQVYHSGGVCLLILGLFAEIGVEAVRLPNEIMPTEGFDPLITWASVILLILGVIVLIYHLIVVVAAAWFGYRPAH